MQEGHVYIFHGNFTTDEHKLKRTEKKNHIPSSHDIISKKKHQHLMQESKSSTLRFDQL